MTTINLAGASIMAAVVAAAVLGLPGAQGQSSEEKAADYTLVPSDLPMAPGDGVAVGATVEAIVGRTNTFRDEQGLGAVEMDGKLRAAAEALAKFMAESHRYGHTADGQRPSQRVEKKGYEFCAVAENIAYQYRSTAYEAEELAEAFMAGWKRSPGHRRNLMSPAAAEIGVGVARSEKTGAYFAVQVLARPASMGVSFRVANRTDEEVRYRVAGAEGDAGSGGGEGREFTLAPRAVRVHERCLPATLRMTAPSEGEKSLTAEDGTAVEFTRTTEGEVEMREGEAPPGASEEKGS